MFCFSETVVRCLWGEEPVGATGLGSPAALFPGVGCRYFFHASRDDPYSSQHFFLSSPASKLLSQSKLTFKHRGSCFDCRARICLRLLFPIAVLHLPQSESVEPFAVSAT